MALWSKFQDDLHPWDGMLSFKSISFSFDGWYHLPHSLDSFGVEQGFGCMRWLRLYVWLVFSSRWIWCGIRDDAFYSVAFETRHGLRGGAARTSRPCSVSRTRGALARRAA